MILFSQFFALLSGAKWFWAILNNWGAIRKILSDVESVGKGMLSRHSTLPSCDETKLLLDAVKILFERGLIDLPGVDESNIAKVLGNVEANLVCEISKEVKP